MARLHLRWDYETTPVGQMDWGPSAFIALFWPIGIWCLLPDYLHERWGIQDLSAVRRLLLGESRWHKRQRRERELRQREEWTAEKERALGIR